MGSALRIGLLAMLPVLSMGGTLRFAQRAEPKTFNPVIALDAPSREVLRRMHADLITINRATQQTMPGLAQSWTVSRDGLEYVLKLRPGLRFSDGHAFTADDVVFSFAAYLDERIHSPQRDLLIVHGVPVMVRKIDALTIAVRTAKPYAVTDRLFDSLAMLPRHLLEEPWRAGKLGEAWAVSAAPETIAGLGPFRLKLYKPGEAVILERNPYYWKHPQPYLDGMEFRFLPDEDTQLARFIAGDLDVLNRVNPKAAPLLASKGLAPMDLGPGLEYNFVCFNLAPGNPNEANFGKLEFRQALSLSVDRPALARLIYQGKAAPIWGHVTPGNRLWYSASLPRPARDTGAAHRLLTSAGFRLDGTTLRDPAGRAVSFSLLVASSQAERLRMATMLQEDWRALGIAVNIVPLELRAMIDRVTNTKQFETCLLGLGGGDADPNAELPVWLSSGPMHLWHPNQREPRTAWEAEIDRLMGEQMVTLNPARRRTMYERVQQIVAEQVPMIFLVSPHVLVARQPRVGNFHPALLDHQTLWNADELTVNGAGRQP